MDHNIKCLNPNCNNPKDWEMQDVIDQAGNYYNVECALCDGCIQELDQLKSVLDVVGHPISVETGEKAYRPITINLWHHMIHEYKVTIAKIRFSSNC
jgi:hypothetical protein